MVNLDQFKQLYPQYEAITVKDGTTAYRPTVGGDSQFAFGFEDDNCATYVDMGDAWIEMHTPEFYSRLAKKVG